MATAEQPLKERLRKFMTGEPSLDMMILFITSKCNSRCRTCFYWDNLNLQGDLTLEELAQLSKTAPRFRFLFISGGEPFMRQELTDVVKMFVDNNAVKYVNIPTSGLLKKRVIAAVEEMTDENPDVRFDLAVSIDGFEETNDRIRGVPGGFKVALETLRGLTEVKKSRQNLYVYVNSTVTSENVEELPALGWYVLSEFDADGHFFNVIRGDPMDSSLKALRPEELEAFYNEVLKINFAYIEREQRSRNSGLGLRLLRKASWKGGYVYAYRTQLASHFAVRDWGIPCTAGRTSVVVDYNGDVRICELRKPLGNLRDYGMDFMKLWGSVYRADELERMEVDRCTRWCTHICFFFNSMIHSKKAVLLEIPRNYLSFQLKGRL